MDFGDLGKGLGKGVTESDPELPGTGKNVTFFGFAIFRVFDGIVPSVRFASRKKTELSAHQMSTPNDSRGHPN